MFSLCNLWSNSHAPYPKVPNANVQIIMITGTIASLAACPLPKFLCMKVFNNFFANNKICIIHLLPLVPCITKEKQTSPFYIEANKWRDILYYFGEYTGTKDTIIIHNHKPWQSRDRVQERSSVFKTRVGVPPLKDDRQRFYRKWVKSSFEQFITMQTRVGSTDGWIISQNAEIWSFIFRQSPEICGICDVI